MKGFPDTYADFTGKSSDGTTNASVMSLFDRVRIRHCLMLWAIRGLGRLGGLGNTVL